MIPCAYCDRPLICAACQGEFVPPDAETYEALSRVESTILCLDCEAVLVCKWCGVPYDAEAGRDGPSGD